MLIKLTLNTHINPLDSVCKHQSFVESVDINSVWRVLLHKWPLGRCGMIVQKEIKHISRYSVCFLCFIWNLFMGLQGFVCPTQQYKPFSPVGSSRGMFWVRCVFAHGPTVQKQTWKDNVTRAEATSYNQGFSMLRLQQMLGHQFNSSQVKALTLHKQIWP